MGGYKCVCEKLSYRARSKLNTLCKKRPIYMMSLANVIVRDDKLEIDSEEAWDPAKQAGWYMTLIFYPFFIALSTVITFGLQWAITCTY